MTDTTWVVAAGAAFFVLVAWIARPRRREAVVAKRPLRRFEEHLEPLSGEFDTAAGAEAKAAFLRDKGFIAIARVAAKTTTIATPGTRTTSTTTTAAMNPAPTGCRRSGRSTR